MGNSKTEILLGFILFYTILTIFIGFMGASMLKSDLEYTTTDTQNVATFTFNSVITGFNELPTWLNTIIFTTFGLILTWLIVTSLPTFNGGS